MIISNSHRYIFVHINKAAGTSVTDALITGLDWNDLALGCHPFTAGDLTLYFESRFGLAKHSTARQIRSVVGEQVWSDYFTFSFVRDPYPKAVSLYTYIERLVTKRGWRKYFSGLRKDEMWTWPATRAYLATNNFSEFIRHPESSQAAGLMPQKTWVYDDDGNLMVDFVGRVENIEADLKKICLRIGFELDSVPTSNQSGDGNWMKHYRDGEDYEVVASFFGSDFEAFDYDRSPPGV